MLMGVETGGGDGGDASPPVEESGGDVPRKNIPMNDLKSDLRHWCIVVLG